MPHSWSLRSTKYPDGLAIKILSMVVEELTRKEKEKGRMRTRAHTHTYIYIYIYIYEIIIDYEWRTKLNVTRWDYNNPHPSVHPPEEKKQTLLHFLNCIIKNVMLTDILRVIVNKLY